MRTWIIGLACIGLLGACQAPPPAGGGGGGGGGGPVVALPADVALRSLGEGAASGMTDDLAVAFRDAAAWQAFWADHAGAEAPPAVDFATEMAVVVVRQHPTGGWVVRLAGATQGGAGTVVSWREEAPGPDAVTIQILTQPWAAAALPRHDGPVAFTQVP